MIKNNLVGIQYWMVGLFFLLGNHSQAQTPRDKVYKPYPYKIKKDTTHNREMLSYKDRAVSLEKYLPDNFVKDGSQDYTKYLQQGLDENKIVLFPDFPVLINEKGLTIQSGARLIFGSNSQLIMKPNDKKSYQVLRLYDVADVKIYNPRIAGDREKHLGKDGEWGMGISMKAARDITIVNADISKCWGDGIYIGSMHKNESENIKIFNAYLDHNRRDGISIISVDGLLIYKGVFSNNFGTGPNTGIVFEPNDYYNKLDNIIVDSPITFNSNGGIKITLWKLTHPDYNPVSIRIESPIDFYSDHAFYISNVRHSIKNRPLKGKITIKNPVWKYNKEALRLNYYNKYIYAPKVYFDNIEVYKSGKNGEDELNMDGVKKIKKSFLRQKRIYFN